MRHLFDIVLSSLAIFLAAAPASAADPVVLPQLVDDRLTIELFASEPDIVTPFGIAVDAEGRVLVVESHTHMRPEDYDGPPHDRLRLLVDNDGDGKADRASNFYEGEQWLMNVAVHANGWVYAVSRNELFRLRDRDGDGVSDERESLAMMETEGDYPHNGFLSLTFDFEGSVLFGLGQNYGASYVLTARDGGSIASERGDGGIFRCSSDGTGLDRIALGFWNPCGLGFDVFGRLFAVDNDPGNRPPCRFIEVVPGGDFGYRRHALEPFIAWNGELPGTLPMITSTAEAPTAVIAYESDQLPRDYRGDLLVSSWSEYRIDRFRVEASGATFAAESEPLLVGDDQFRPAGIAVAPDGSLFVSDWIDRSYPVHGRGRVWRIRSKSRQLTSRRSASSAEMALTSADRVTREAAARRLVGDGEAGIQSLKTQLRQQQDARARSAALAGLTLTGKVDIAVARLALTDTNSSVREQAVRTLPAEFIEVAAILARERDLRVRTAALRRITSRRQLPQLTAALLSDDRFERQAAGVALRRVGTLGDLRELFRHGEADVRHAAFLALRETHPDELETLLPTALDDPSESVRFSAIEWIAYRANATYRQRLIDDLSARPMSRQLFEATLAAVAAIDGLMQDWRPGRNGDWWKARSAAPEIAANLLNVGDASAATLQRAIEFLPTGHDSLTVERLERLIDQIPADLGLQLSVVRALRESPQSARLLQEIAADRRRPAAVRAEAVMGLVADDAAQRAALVAFALDSPAAVQHEALRSLRGSHLSTEQVGRLRSAARGSTEYEQLLALVLGQSPSAVRPPVTDLDGWLALLGGTPDPAAGARVFFHERGPACSRCHRVDGRGQQIGPNFLRTRGVAAFTRRQLLEAILQPSKEIALGYVPMQFVTTDGRVHVGVPKTEDDDAYQLYDASGKSFRIARSDIEELIPAKKSIMPDGLVDQMTDMELRDLIEYLAQPAEVSSR